MFLYVKLVVGFNIIGNERTAVMLKDVESVVVPFRTGKNGQCFLPRTNVLT